MITITRHKSEETRKKDIARANEWQKSNYKRYGLILSKKNDSDIIRTLESQPSKNAYIVSALKEKILKEKED